MDDGEVFGGGAGDVRVRHGAPTNPPHRNRLIEMPVASIVIARPRTRGVDRQELTIRKSSPGQYPSGRIIDAAMVRKP